MSLSPSALRVSAPQSPGISSSLLSSYPDSAPVLADTPFPFCTLADARLEMREDWRAVGVDVIFTDVTMFLRKASG
jgi:hypothetical protein